MTKSLDPTTRLAQPEIVFDEITPVSISVSFSKDASQLFCVLQNSKGELLGDDDTQYTFRLTDLDKYMTDWPQLGQVVAELQNVVKRIYTFDNLDKKTSITGTAEQKLARDTALQVLLRK